MGSGQRQPAGGRAARRVSLACQHRRPPRTEIRSRHLGLRAQSCARARHRHRETHLGELESLVGRRLVVAEEQEAEALNLVRSGMARMAVLTLGQHGAIMACADGVIRIPALSEAVQSAVGAGDAFLAAMILALARGASNEDALAWGIAAGSAAIARIGTARIERTEVERRLDQLASTRSFSGVRPRA
ncbi:MAG: hypothetical protein J2P47_13525 [Acetobacteraceae bacterium]|nr:hypothetical protein [Acetobacteraceae bacterium]